VYIAGSSDQVRHVHRGEQGGDLAALGERGVERVAAAVQRGAGGGPGQGEARRPSSSVSQRADPVANHLGVSRALVSIVFRGVEGASGRHAPARAGGGGRAGLPA
jgi:hypothetical protein